MALTTAPDFTDGILTAAKLQQLTDAINERTPRVGSQMRTSAVGTFTTTETVCDTITVVLADGNVYGIHWYAQMQSSVAGDDVGVKIREDSDTGTILTNQRIECATSAVGYGVSQYAQYTAVSSGSKTFVGTGVRSAGTGNITAGASANQQAHIFVVLIST